MLFNSLTFLIFITFVFLGYWKFLSGQILLRNVWLLAASYTFYGFWDWRFLGLIAFSSLVDYLVGRRMEQCDSLGSRRFYLFLSLGINLGSLGFFKYFNFFLGSFSDLLREFGYSGELGSLSIILPVGISFYTFQTLSYSIDVYNRKIPACRSILNFFTYVSFFPQLVAGPIERASQLLPQFQKRHVFNRVVAIDGTKQVLWGFFKKVVVADNAAIFVDVIFSDMDNQSGGVLLIGLVFFAIQIYCDFSGYSDIAIGVAKLFGFRLMRNFSCPYFSRSISEFWRRWHISLSTWFRDYIYIPLGGSRNGIYKSVRNIMIVFLVSGLWHGANWTFLFWGFLNGLLLASGVFRGNSNDMKGTIAANRVFPTFREMFLMGRTFLLTCLLWTFFRADTISEAFQYLLLLVVRIAENPLKSFFQLPLSGKEFTLDLASLMLGILILFSVEWIQRDKQHGLADLKLSRPIASLLFVTLGVLVLEFFYGRGSFIYFQF